MAVALVAATVTSLGNVAQASEHVANRVISSVHAAAIPNPTIHYSFDTDLNDEFSNSTLTTPSACPADPCNSAASFGSDTDGKYWTWSSTAARGGGFTLDTAADIGTSYTIALKFSFNVVTSWRKIIDYKNRVSDHGFYYYNSKLQFYPYTAQTSVTTYPAGTVLDLVAVRDGSVSPATFTVYAVGTDNSLTQIFVANDSNNSSLPHTYGSPTKTRLGFFYDDTATGSEAASTGKVYDLRIWANTKLTTSEVQSQVEKPSQVTGVTVSPNDGSITVTWNGSTGATTYLASAGGQSCTVTAPATTCTITGLTNGQSVTASVQAINGPSYSAIATSSSVLVGPTITTTATTTTTSTVAPTTTTPATTTTVHHTTTTIHRTTLSASASSSSGKASKPALPTSGTSSTWLALVAGVLILVGLQLIRRSRRLN